MTAPVRRPRRSTMASSAALLALVLVVGGCSDTDEDPDTVAAESDSRPSNVPAEDHSDEASDSEGEEETLEPPDTPEPDIDLTGPADEIERIYREQEEYRSWLFAHPDPANTERLARITHSDCPCWETDHQLLTRYAERNQWWTGPQDKIVKIDVIEQSSANLVKLHVTWQRDGTEELIDETGEVHSKLPAARGVQEVIMRRGSFDPEQPDRDRSSDPWKVIVAEDLEYEKVQGGD